MTRPIGISVPHRKVEDDDDIQAYVKPWLGLTDEARNEILGSHNPSYERHIANMIEAKL
jgi:hypothetical protein